MTSKIKITLVKSMINRPEKHRKVLRGLGLNKIDQSVTIQDTPTNRGMANKVAHLVNIEERSDEA